MLSESKPQSALQHQLLVLRALKKSTPGANNISNESHDWSSLVKPIEVKAFWVAVL